MAVATGTIASRSWLADDPWLDLEDVEWFGPAEPALAALRASAAAVLPEPILPARPAPPSYREARRAARWSGARKRRFALRFVPTATVVAGAAAALPWLLFRSSPGATPAAAPLPLSSGPTAGRTATPQAPTAAPRATTGSRTPAGTYGETAATSDVLLLSERLAASRAGAVALVANVSLPEAAAAPAKQPKAVLTNVTRAKAEQTVQWHDAIAIGLPYAGRLENGVRLPQEGDDYVTWDPVNDRVPNRAWRLYGTEELVRTLLKVIREYRAANPGAPRVVVGDMSRKGGGPLDEHVSHQNGLDVDVYFPRKDRELADPGSVSNIDMALAQDLVDRFVAAGAQLVLVGPSTPLTGPSGVVIPYPNHDNHIHVRLRHPVGGQASD
ncbi:MAG: penicillin-insensitive murein endopeptidase [Thermoleophilia bacterium]